MAVVFCSSFRVVLEGLKVSKFSALETACREFASCKTPKHLSNSLSL